MPRATEKEWKTFKEIGLDAYRIEGGQRVDKVHLKPRYNRDVPRDGDCLFHSLRNMKAFEGSIADFRRSLANHARSSDFHEVSVKFCKDEVHERDLVRSIETPRMWVGTYCSLVISSLLKISIVTVQRFGAEFVMAENSWQTLQKMSKEDIGDAAKEYFVLYHEVGKPLSPSFHKNHYCAVEIRVDKRKKKVEQEEKSEDSQDGSLYTSEEEENDEEVEQEVEEKPKTKTDPIDPFDLSPEEETVLTKKKKDMSNEEKTLHRKATMKNFVKERREVDTEPEVKPVKEEVKFKDANVESEVLLIMGQMLKTVAETMKRSRQKY